MRKLLLFSLLLFIGACSTNEKKETELQNQSSYDLTTKSTDTDDPIESVKLILYQAGQYIKSVDFDEGEKMVLKGLNDNPYQIYAIANYSEMEDDNLLPLGLSLVPGEPLIGAAYSQNPDLMPDVLVAKRDFDPKTESRTIELNFKRIVGKITVTIKNAEELFADGVKAIHYSVYQFPNLINFDALDMNHGRGYSVEGDFFSYSNDKSQSIYTFPTKPLNGIETEPNVVLCDIMVIKETQSYNSTRLYSKNPLLPNTNLELNLTVKLPDNEIPLPNTTKTKSNVVHSLDVQLEEIVHGL